jgi:chorismate dehydratase
MSQIARIGTVSYLNALPLTLPLEKGVIHSKYEFEITKAPPARLAHLMKVGSLDVSILSVVEPLIEKRFRIISGMSICSNGPSLTVQLFYKGELSKIKVLGLNKDSKTSNILAQVILNEKYQIRPKTVVVSNPDKSTLDQVDAFVSIGDRTFDLLKSDMQRIDLGEAWKDLTGFPIVFAVWVLAPHYKDRDIIPVLRSAREMGLQMLDEIVPRISRTRDIPMEVLTRYFHENIDYILETDEKKGIAKLFEFGSKIDQLPKPRKVEYYFG